MHTIRADIAVGYLLVAAIAIVMNLQSVSAQVVIRFESTRMPVREGMVGEVQLVTTGEFNETFTINLTFTPITAEHVKDFSIFGSSALTTEVHFTVGQRLSSPARLIATQDSVWEGKAHETVRVTFDLPPDMENFRKGSPSVLTISIEDDDEIVISFVGNDKVVLQENVSTFFFQLKAQGSYARPFQVAVICFDPATEFPAKEGEDYVLIEDKVQFTEDSIKQNTTFLGTDGRINIVDDMIAEPNEPFICAIIGRDDGRVAGEPDSITVFIEDDDVLEVNFEDIEHVGDEGGTLRVKLLASTDFANPFKMEIFTKSLPNDSPQKPYEANLGADYTLQSGGIVTFNFNDLGRSSNEAIIELKDDCLVEGIEFFALSFVSINEADDEGSIFIQTGESNTAVVGINDLSEIFTRPEKALPYLFDEQQLVRVRYEAFYNDSTGNLKPVNDMCFHNFGFNLEINSEDKKATASADYIAASREIVHFNAGERYSSYLEITLIDDEVAEPTESFQLNYDIKVSRNGAETDRVLKLNVSSEIEINDNDEAGITLNVSEVSYREDIGVIQLNLLSNAAFQHDQVIDIQAYNETAENTNDYELLNKTVTIRSGEMESEAIMINIVADEIPEDTETFIITFTLSESVRNNGGVVGSINEVKISIEDDDALFIQFLDTELTVSESAGIIAVNMKVFQGTVTEPFNVTIFGQSGTAMDTYDYLITSESIVTFETDQITSTGGIIIIVDDNIYEGKETFTIAAQLDNETARRFRILPPFPTINLTDDDDPGTCIISYLTSLGADDDVLFNFELDNIQVEENVGFFNVCVIKTGTRNTETSVLITPSDTDMDFSGFMANRGDDYDDSIVEIIFQPNDTVVCVDIPIIDDSVLEQNETFIVNLVRPIVSSGVEIGNMNKSFLTIQNDDKIFVQFSTDNITVNEGDGMVEIMLQSGLSDVPYSVVVTPSTGSAIADIDFNSSSLLANFDVRERNTTLFISIIDDSLIKPPETFTLDITIPPYATQLGVGLESPHMMTITITDNDCVNVSLTPQQIQVDEGRSYFFTVEARGMFVAPFNIEIMPVEMSATDEDFDTTTLLVTFNPGESKKELSIKTVNDDVNEGTETFRIELVVDLSKLNETYICIDVNVGSLLVNITDDDDVRAHISKNDSISGDPLLTVPILLNSTNEAFKDPSLCLQFHGLHNTVFNLISDSCLTVNAKYKTVEDGLNIVSELGLVAVGNNNTCHRLRVDIDGCRTWMDGELINGRKLDDGIEVINSRNRSRISVPNCDNVDLVMWVVCQHIDGVDMLKYVITRGLNLRPTSHGILGQFWNIPFTIEPYNGPYGSLIPEEVNDYYVLTMSPPLSKKRSFVAEYYYYTWDLIFSPCFYAGNLQGGPLREVQDGPNDPPIQGYYRDYIVFSLFDTTPKYNRFTATCTIF